MTNRIGKVEVRDCWRDPAQPEVWISIRPEQICPTTAVRGRLTGPRCPYAATVEVAYPLKPFPRLPEGLPELSRRVIIPEACLWEPESPFLYQGVVELWEENSCCDQAPLSHGLRSLGLGKHGLRLNGKPLKIRGIARNQCSEEEARQLRRAGYNTWLADVAAETASLWECADRFGFLVLGRIAGGEEAIEQAEILRRHPSCLGWLFTAEAWEQIDRKIVASNLLPKGSGLLAGLELGRLPPKMPEEKFHFILCPESLLGSASLPHLPLLVAGGNSLLGNERPGTPSDQAVLGWIQSR